MSRLAGKRALITGGARGIGRAFAQRHVAEAAIAVGMNVAGQASIERAVSEVSEVSEADYIAAQTYNVDGGNWMS